MKPGASPESGFAGVWRVVGAKPAPWAPSIDGRKARYPLLEYAIEFADGEVKGPARVACKDATFSSGVSAAEELFGGQLHHSEAAAKALNLAGSQRHDLPRHLRRQTARLLRRRERRARHVRRRRRLHARTADRHGSAQYTPGFSGPAFDCAKAKTAGEQMICRDAALSKADRKLNEAYRRLKATETPASFATVQSAQRDWLAYVAKSCRADGSMPDDAGEQNALQGCLDEQFQRSRRAARRSRGRQSRRARARAAHARR